jgi:hypothetical protein
VNTCRRDPIQRNKGSGGPIAAVGRWRQSTTVADSPENIFKRKLVGCCIHGHHCKGTVASHSTITRRLKAGGLIWCRAVKKAWGLSVGNFQKPVVSGAESDVDHSGDFWRPIILTSLFFLSFEFSARSGDSCRGSGGCRAVYDRVGKCVECGQTMQPADSEGPLTLVRVGAGVTPATWGSIASSAWGEPHRYW